MRAIARKRLVAFTTLAIAVGAGCGNGAGDERVDTNTSAYATCGPHPSVGPCVIAVCDSGGWEFNDKPAGTVCNGSGKCNANGVCVMPPPPPPPPPGCDNPPPPRFTAGQNDNYPNGADILSCTHPAAG